MKNAFLILAHNNFDVVKKFLSLMDSKDNDFYIHINKKVKSFPRKDLESSVKKGKIIFTDRVAVGYCNYSMVEAIKVLFNTAIKEKYDYYHVISNSDLPLKTSDEINRFFEENKGKEFVGFKSTYDIRNSNYRNYFNAMVRSRNRILSKFAIYAKKYLINLQMFLKMDRLKNCDYTVKKGFDWYSVTHEAAVYLMEQEPKFKKYFYRAYCPTEFFPQTVLYNSDFKDKLYDITDECRGCMRLIDWKRGAPYTFRENDFDELISSDMLFARKFQENYDMNIVNKLYYFLGGKNNDNR